MTALKLKKKSPICGNLKPTAHTRELNFHVYLKFYIWIFSKQVAKNYFLLNRFINNSGDCSFIITDASSNRNSIVSKVTENKMHFCDLILQWTVAKSPNDMIQSLNTFDSKLPKWKVVIVLPALVSLDWTLLRHRYKFITTRAFKLCF